MEDLILLVFQAVLELLVEILSYIPVDWPWKNGTLWKSKSLSERCVLWLIIGIGLAVISMTVFKKTWIVHPLLRVLNLVLAPVISAHLSQALARRRARKNPAVVPRDHFWQAFWFTLGLVVVRFVYAARH